MAARAAHETAVRLGAEPLQGALEALARRGRLELGAGVSAERALAGLTPREVEVLRLLVEGRSNRQIAEQLFIRGCPVRRGTSVAARGDQAAASSLVGVTAMVASRAARSAGKCR
jgi:FixJ family two-component response regulator